MKILLAGGGTGGHVAPILAVVSEIKKMAEEKNTQEPEFMLITPDEHFKELIERAGIKVRKIKAGKLRRYFDMKNLSDIFKIAFGIIQSIYHIWKFEPDVVFSKGGFASVPVVVASWMLGVPIITHESDITPGLANKINSFFATKVLVSFDETQKYFNINKTILTGNPIREDISMGIAQRAKKTFGISNDLPTLLVMGGSQGAKRVNEAILVALDDLLENFNIIHVCGKNNFNEVKKRAEERKIGNIERYKPFQFLFDEMKDAYAICDLIVSRAGANSIAEIIEVGRPSIIIPLSTAANGHQESNAKWLSDKGLARVIYENELSGGRLFKEIVNLYESEKKNAGIAKNIIEYKKNMHLKPAEAIAKTILESARAV